jgi:hypothetical protein
MGEHLSGTAALAKGVGARYYQPNIRLCLSQTEYYLVEYDIEGKLLQASDAAPKLRNSEASQPSPVTLWCLTSRRKNLSN